MERKTIKLSAEDPMYQALVDEVANASDDKLIIVARSAKNKKDDSIAPVGIRQGIYFYVALDLESKLAFFENVTPDQIEKAKRNTVERAIIGDMMEVLFGIGKPCKDWVYHGEQMIVLTSSMKMNGSGILFCDDFLEALKAKLGGFYILPSSIHELIIVPDESMKIDDLTFLVNEVNATEVRDEEYLADMAFKADDFFVR